MDHQSFLKPLSADMATTTPLLTGDGAPMKPVATCIYIGGLTVNLHGFGQDDLRRIVLELEGWRGIQAMQAYRGTCCPMKDAYLGLTFVSPDSDPESFRDAVRVSQGLRSKEGISILVQLLPQGVTVREVPADGCNLRVPAIDQAETIERQVQRVCRVFQDVIWTADYYCWSLLDLRTFFARHAGATLLSWRGDYASGWPGYHVHTEDGDQLIPEGTALWLFHTPRSLAFESLRAWMIDHHWFLNGDRHAWVRSADAMMTVLASEVCTVAEYAARRALADKLEWEGAAPSPDPRQHDTF